FFKPRLLKHFGTFQDGGLQHNNPLNIAMWELRNLWPSRVIDFALSIGTGVSQASTVAYGTGPYSPVKDRFVARVFRTVMKSMDGERVWREIFNSLAEKDRDCYHRLNLPLDGKEPDLDDVESMTDLKQQSLQWLVLEKRLAAPVDSIIASMFYFEIDTYDLQPDGLFRCVGIVYCRLILARPGREYLYTLLKSTSSYFCIDGKPTPCVDHIPKNGPPFRRVIKFTVESLEDSLNITLLGLTSSPKSISGMPQSVSSLVKAQCLDAPFGRADCAHAEKALPDLPQHDSR
ncbi:hypothetical protein LTR95_012132, partial [Oleoguttula sp. CCFEE 5521]